MSTSSQAYHLLAGQLADRGIAIEPVKTKLKQQHIETPSWGYGNSGTRFRVFPWPGAARTTKEKLADAAMVNNLTGVAPSVALHIPWDQVADWDDLKKYAETLGVKIGAINPNVFQEEIYKFGSICHAEASVRRRAIAHIRECIDIMKLTGSRDLSLWFADGTNYAGQDNLRDRKHRMQEALAEVYQALPPNTRMLIEYKFFEPAFYHTDLADWGMAYATALKLGPQAQVLVDTGHHAPGTNIEHIVAFLLDEGRLGGFHFNNRKYADDDLIVGSVNPFELFLIFNELVAAENSNENAPAACAKNVAYMIDQSHNIEPKIEAMVQAVINCQVALAKALLVNRQKLAERQAAGDVLGAHRELALAYETDVRPLLAQVREEMGLHPDPIAALKASRYEEKIAAARGGAAEAGGGYPGA
ncbi:MAG: L-rhamnose isomerase [candidate division KSB1 bacterium]|nr:L-rhamnose isomerase [candidate division KSB1 bacterium]MDZ7367794.1 L-rhamnose isomerase [candidate division KSB1 bacterium]MDZ7406615.1 L-rhamnose isomerase [candidate division KSB1 bacterium]